MVEISDTDFLGWFKCPSCGNMVSWSGAIEDRPTNTTCLICEANGKDIKTNFIDKSARTTNIPITE